MLRADVPSRSFDSATELLPARLRRTVPLERSTTPKDAEVELRSAVMSGIFWVSISATMGHAFARHATRSAGNR